MLSIRFNAESEDKEEGKEGTGRKQIYLHSLG